MALQDIYEEMVNAIDNGRECGAALDIAAKAAAKSEPDTGYSGAYDELTAMYGFWSENEPPEISRALELGWKRSACELVGAGYRTGYESPDGKTFLTEIQLLRLIRTGCSPADITEWFERVTPKGVKTPRVE